MRTDMAVDLFLLTDNGVDMLTVIGAVIRGGRAGRRARHDGRHQWLANLGRQYVLGHRLARGHGRQDPPGGRQGGRLALGRLRGCRRGHGHLCRQHACHPSCQAGSMLVRADMAVDLFLLMDNGVDMLTVIGAVVLGGRAGPRARHDGRRQWLTSLGRRYVLGHRQARAHGRRDTPGGRHGGRLALGRLRGRRHGHGHLCRLHPCHHACRAGPMLVHTDMAVNLFLFMGNGVDMLTVIGAVILGFHTGHRARHDGRHQWLAKLAKGMSVAIAGCGLLGAVLFMAVVTAFGVRVSVVRGCCNGGLRGPGLHMPTDIWTHPATVVLDDIGDDRFLDNGVAWAFASTRGSMIVDMASHIAIDLHHYRLHARRQPRGDDLRLDRLYAGGCGSTDYILMGIGVTQPIATRMWSPTGSLTTS